MDIGGVNRMRGGIMPLQNEVKKQNSTSADRDAEGNAYQDKKKPARLTPEQETEALARLNSLPAFIRSGLKGELIREEGSAPHILVKDAKGHVVRHLPYEQIVEIYLNRFSENPTGQLLRQAV